MKTRTIYTYEYKEEQRLKKLYKLEYKKCYEYMVEASEKGFTKTLYQVSLESDKSPKWNHKNACVYIINKLKKKMISVFYEAPNKLYINWSNEHDIKNKEKQNIEIEKFLLKEDLKTRSTWKNIN